MSRTSGFRLRPVFALLAVAILAATGSAGLGTVVKPAPTTPTSAAPLPPPKASIVVDVDTGKIIDGLNYHASLPPASLTKVITALAVGDMAPAKAITISARAAAAPADKLFMKAGTVWTADELMHELLISSANDAAVALAEDVGGTLEGFQTMFAKTALALGMADHPVLMDPAGLDGPDGVDGGNLVSARDLAIAARALLAKPALAQIVATPVYYFDGPDAVHHRLTNHNKLFLVTYAGAIGVKTGYTRRAGACLIAASTRGGRTMLTVVLSGANPTQQAKDLLDKGFATPADAEPAADQLPPVNSAAADASAATAPAAVPAAQSAPSPPPPGNVGPAAAPGRIKALWSSWRVLIAAVLVLLFSLTGVAAIRAVAVRRRRRRIFSAPRYRSAEDRRAA